MTPVPFFCQLQQLILHVRQRQSAGGGGLGRLDLPRQVGDGLFQIGVVAGEQQSGAVLHQRGTQIPAPMVDLGEAADGRKILRRTLEHARELDLSLLELTQLEERAAKRHAGRQVSRMNRQTGAAGVDSFLELARSAALLGQLRKSNRRRILLDPAPQVVDTGVFGHANRAGARRQEVIVTSAVLKLVCPISSVAVSVTV